MTSPQIVYDDNLFKTTEVSEWKASEATVGSEAAPAAGSDECGQTTGGGEFYSSVSLTGY